MEKVFATIRKILEERDIDYKEYESERGYTFAFPVSDEELGLGGCIFIATELRAGCVAVMFPFRADPKFFYLLYEKLAQENDASPYGVFKCDPSDGRLTCSYNFPVGHGLHEGNLVEILYYVVEVAENSYDTMKQYALGNLSRETREEAICSAQKLIIDLSTYGSV